MTISNKTIAFSYLIDKFIEWSESINQENVYKNKFTKLFLLKQLFLVSAIKSDSYTDLLDTFNNFYAMPYGPVESDIYTFISSDLIPNYTISDRGITGKEIRVDLELTEYERNYLNDSYYKLREKNDKLITFSAFDLVNITHRWESWDKAFRYARFNGSHSTKMDNELIRKDKVQFFGV